MISLGVMGTQPNFYFQAAGDISKGDGVGTQSRRAAR